MMIVNIVIGDVVWEVVSCYCSQTDRSVNEKEKFYKLMGKFVKGEKVLVGRDFNGTAGSDMGGFGEAHGGWGWGVWNWVNKLWRNQIVRFGSWQRAALDECLFKKKGGLYYLDQVKLIQ